MAWEVERIPVFSEHSALPRAEIRNAHEKQPSGAEEAQNPSQVRFRIRDVFERVIHHHRVEGALVEFHGFQRADACLDAPCPGDRAGLRRRI
jgi:hypothetical protein